MANNAARQLNQPTTAPKINRHRQHINHRLIRQRVKVSVFEKVFTVLMTLILVSLVVWTLSVKNTVANQQANLQKLESKRDSLVSNNRNQREKINEQETSASLKKVADKNKMSDVTPKVRNVSK